MPIDIHRFTPNYLSLSPSAPLSFPVSAGNVSLLMAPETLRWRKGERESARVHIVNRRGETARGRSCATGAHGQWAVGSSVDNRPTRATLATTSAHHTRDTPCKMASPQWTTNDNRTQQLCSNDSALLMSANCLAIAVIGAAAIASSALILLRLIGRSLFNSATSSPSVSFVVVLSLPIGTLQ